MAATMERFWGYVERSEGCWAWTGGTFARGYAQFWDGTPTYAHRWLYQQLHGPVPDGWDVDHTCHNGSGCLGGRDCPHHLCVNPDHLEAVPHRVNTQRGQTGRHNAIKTHCPQGHPYAGDNLYVEATTGRRRCLICKRKTNRRYEARQYTPR